MEELLQSLWWEQQGSQTAGRARRPESMGKGQGVKEEAERLAARIIPESQQEPVGSDQGMA